ncbi:glucan endo-1,3-beta-glucosidase-like [Pyrus x bretschneideri]|uniref:glucan endo-1,3-beta-glucosidase-like n=1 Tax=Pyrus x bretschneideri TaxID=225117 RepID=UPI002030E83C|nr:glucan endo-1,3-beta-glucosidase-like [Pyrus x bretschneideri]
MAGDLLFLFLAFFVMLSTALGSPIGVCYGMLGNDLPPPTEVINMYKLNQIGLTRIYEPNHEALKALRGSGINVLVGVRNDELQQLASTESAAEDWVAAYIRPYWPQVNFRYIAVGNEVIPGEVARYVLPAMQKLHNALSSGVLNSIEQIKVSTAVAMSVLGESYPPSAATFSQDTAAYMVPIARYLNSIGAPLLVNVYPYFTYVEKASDVSLTYALFASESAVVIDDGLSYYNLFEAMVDAVYASLEKAGAPQVRVVVSETGWPSGGNGNVTTPSIAQKYNSNLVRHVLSSHGTPRRPGKSVETYLFAMFNENMKPGEAVERQWGLFYPNKRPVYPINFEGQRMEPVTESNASALLAQSAVILCLCLISFFLIRM